MGEPLEQISDDLITPSQVVREMATVIRQVDQAEVDYRTKLRAEAAAEREYRQHRMECWMNLAPDVTKLPAAAKEAWVDANAADHRYRRDLAVGESKAAWERVRNLRAKLNGWQSVSNSIRAELEMDKVGPDW